MGESPHAQTPLGMPNGTVYPEFGRAAESTKNSYAPSTTPNFASHRTPEGTSEFNVRRNLSLHRGDPMELDRASFWLQTQAHIHENIKFADTKAAQVLVLNIGLITALYVGSEKWTEGWRIAAIGVASILGLGILAAMSVIRPRGRQNHTRGAGLCDAIRISLGSETRFLSDSASATDEELVSQLRQFVFDRATIDRSKYYWLNCSLLLSLVGWILAFAIFAVSRLIKVAAIG